MEIRGRAVHHGARRSSQHLQSLRQGECPELEASLDSIGIRVQPGLHVETLFQNETFKKKKRGGWRPSRRELQAVSAPLSVSRAGNPHTSACVPIYDGKH